jgi:hypothetical protein
LRGRATLRFPREFFDGNLIDPLTIEVFNTLSLGNYATRRDLDDVRGRFFQQSDDPSPPFPPPSAEIVCRFCPDFQDYFVFDIDSSVSI